MKFFVGRRKRGTRWSRRVDRIDTNDVKFRKVTKRGRDHMWSEGRISGNNGSGFPKRSNAVCRGDERPKINSG